MGIKETQLSNEEVQKKVSKISKPFEKDYAKLVIKDIIDATFTNLENDKLKIDEEHKSKITKSLSEALQNKSREQLLNTKRNNNESHQRFKRKTDGDVKSSSFFTRQIFLPHLY